ncbi:MAG TPA: hypothetical protein VHX38_39155 [Pseudonocardiaceae bacterium]|nr:hypothetical protein [Pseudonocardiaceae bacterium]
MHVVVAAREYVRPLLQETVDNPVLLLAVHCRCAAEGKTDRAHDRHQSGGAGVVGGEGQGQGGDRPTVHQQRCRGAGDARGRFLAVVPVRLTQTVRIPAAFASTTSKALQENRFTCSMGTPSERAAY